MNTPETFTLEFLKVNKLKHSLYLKSTNLSNTLIDCVVNAGNQMIVVREYSSANQLKNAFNDTTNYTNLIVEVDFEDSVVLAEIRKMHQVQRLFIVAPDDQSIEHLDFGLRFVRILSHICGWCVVGAFLNYRHLNNKLSVGRSNIHGFGVFASANIAVKTTLFHLDGELVDLKNEKNFSFLDEWNAVTSDILLVRKSPTIYGFINHSKTPNCVVDIKNKVVISLKNIKFGDELFLDYTKEPLPKAYLEKYGNAYL